MQILSPVADGLVDEFGERRELDLVTAYTRLYPFRVISTLLDIPRQDQDLVHGHVMRLFKFPWDPQAGREARDAMIAYLRPLLAERRKNPKTDLISLLAAAEVNGKRMTDQELLDAVRFLYPAAGENTTNGLGMLMYRVLSDQSVYGRLLANPTDRAAAVEESLRLEPPVPVIIRYLHHPVVIHGTRVPANHYVLLAISSANRDPARFEDPDRFSLDRGTINHITFGRGPHFCLGTHLARAELRVTLDVMLSRLPGLRLVEPDNVRVQGALLRGPKALRVRFDEILPAA
jgi:cytochrome P450